MRVWNRRRLAGRVTSALLVAIPLLLAGGSVGVAQAPRQQVESRSNASKQLRNPRGTLVLMLTTGLEDVQEMALSLEDAKAAKDSGYLKDVIWVARGRGVEALGGGIRARPFEMLQLAREAKASGVRIIVSGPDLKPYGIDADKLDPKPDEVVADAMARVAELVSQGCELVRY
jgi:hypothetical protein